MRHRITVIVLSVCVCYHKIYCLPRFCTTRSYRILYGVFMVFTMWLLLKMWCHCHLPHFLASFQWTNETVMASFQLEKYNCNMVSHRSNNMTGLSLIVPHWQIAILYLSQPTIQENGNVVTTYNWQEYFFQFCMKVIQKGIKKLHHQCFNSAWLHLHSFITLQMS